MKLLLAGTALLALAATGSAARAGPFDFTFTGSLVTFTVPETGSYQILALGAQGGSLSLPGNLIGSGGLGAEIGGDFDLNAGQVLQIAVGGVGSSNGGGGGSFVVGPGNTPLVIAGAGGGGGASEPPFGPPTPVAGFGGLIGTNGGGVGNIANGGTNGSGGGPGFDGGGGGGGGFLSNGGSDVGTGGDAFPDLAGGFFGGGFGGGGGGARGAGGGGGYSGGGGGPASAASQGPGGGGGSFDAGLDQILMADFNAGNGEVTITEVPTAIPEPATIALLGAGLLGLAAIRRRAI